MESSKRTGLFWIGGALIIAALLAASLNWAVTLIPPTVETRWARKLPVFNDSECELPKDAAVALEKLRKRLLLPGDDEFSISLRIVRAREVNAFAFLGGSIYINTGLLKGAFNADEVAGVVAHEMAHVRNRDVLHSISGRLVTAILLAQIGETSGLANLFTQVANLTFTRSQEEAADRSAISRLQAAHIATQPLANFFKRLPSFGPTMLSDHPDSESRSQMAASAVVESPTPALSEDEWNALKTACAL